MLINSVFAKKLIYSKVPQEQKLHTHMNARTLASNENFGDLIKLTLDFPRFLATDDHLLGTTVKEK